jgi:hypothetical protein
MEDSSETFRDDEWDSKFFGLIYELVQKNRSRYEIQTEQILKNGSLKVEFSGATIEFKITPTGCSYSISDDEASRTSGSWLRMGWGKSAKRKALPDYFARAEASVLINRES